MVEKSEMIFGVRAVIEAIQAGKDIDKILVKKDIQSDLFPCDTHRSPWLRFQGRSPKLP